MTIDPAISLAMALALTTLFAAGAVHKAQARSEFVGIVANYRLAPAALAPAIALAIVALEAVLAIALIAPPTRAGAGVAAAFLLAAYGAAIGFNLVRGRTNIDCGCSFGGGTNRIGPGLLLHNAVLVAAALVIALPAGARVLGAFDFAYSVLFAAAAAVLYLTFEKLRANADRFALAGRTV